MRKFSIALGATLILATSSAFADSPSAQSTAPATTTAASDTTQLAPNNSASAATDTKTSDNEVICKRMDPATGSRLGTREICKTKGQWDAIQREAQKNVNTMQEGSGQAGYDIGH